MKVYAVWGDNGESWEDNDEWVECICSTFELAIQKQKKLDDKAKEMYKNHETWSLWSYKVKEYEVLEK